MVSAKAADTIAKAGTWGTSGPEHICACKETQGNVAQPQLRQADGSPEEPLLERWQSGDAPREGGLQKSKDTCGNSNEAAGGERCGITDMGERGD